MGYETLTGGLPESEGPKSGGASEGARGDSDKALLEAAAKAAGIIPEWRYVTRNGNVWDKERETWIRAWNPLTDDGDALRLAVRLGILSRNEILAELIAQEERHHDRATATRRAIVRATAALKEKQTNA